MFSSIKAKIVILTIAILCILSVIFTVCTVFGYNNARRLVIHTNDFSITTYAEKINKEILKLDNNAVDLAEMGEIYYHSKQGKWLANKFVVNTFENYKDSLGGGIWFKPYTIIPNKKLHCVYAFRNYKNQIVIDEHFESESYDYVTQSWWEDILPVILKGEKIAWSKPYIEAIGSEELMTTVGSGMYSDSGEFLGMSTVDWKIGDIVNTISKMKPTPNSFALFADKNNDYIIVYSDDKMKSVPLFGKSLENIPWYNKELRNLDKITYKGKDYISFVKTLDNGMLFVINIPEDEITADIDKRIKLLFLSLIITSILIAAWIYSFLKRNIYKPIDKLIAIANDIGHGNLNSKITIDKPLEFAQLASTFNTMKDDIRVYIKRISVATVEKEKMESELAIARTIQYSALPATFYPEIKEFKLFASMDTAKEVGGDFYDFFFIDSHKFMFLIADVSGKGVPAALFMMKTKTLIKNLAIEISDPKTLIEKINNQICDNNEQGFFVTMFACIVDTQTGKVAYINAGHNPPLIKRNNGKFKYLDICSNLILGAYSDFKYDIEETILNPDDVILLYTDGVTEALNSKEEMYGEMRFVKCLNGDTNNDLTDLKTFIQNIKDEVRNFRSGHEQSDDITLLAFQYKGYKKQMEEKIELPAEIKNFVEFNTWLENMCSKYEVPMNYLMKLQLVAEEIFVNITSYAYTETGGEVDVIFAKDANLITLRFEDKGIPYNPLEKEDPDITLSAQERPIGGLGIFLVKQYVDDITYDYSDDKNILTLKLMIK